MKTVVKQPTIRPESKRKSVAISVDEILLANADTRWDLMRTLLLSQRPQTG